MNMRERDERCQKQIAHQADQIDELRACLRNLVRVTPYSSDDKLHGVIRREAQVVLSNTAPLARGGN